MLDSMMNNSVTSAPIIPVIRIGISGLPNLTSSMVAGGLYILVAEIPSARFPMLSGSLAGALSDRVPCTIVLPADPLSFIHRIESFGGINTTELINADRLQVFVMQDEFSKNMFRLSAESFVLELEQFEIPDNSYFIFEQADDLLSLHDISLALEQVDTLKKWFSQKGVTALLIFSRITEAHAGTINALMDHLAGIVRLGGSRDGLELTFDYWQSPEGAIAARNYPLLTLDSGLYEASTRSAPSLQAVGEQRYERKNDVDSAVPHYFYMDPNLASLAKQMSGIWKRVDTLVGMIHATRNSRSATSILCFQQDTNLRQMAETVHTIRLSSERHAQIVVQEKEASMRYQDEALLVRLGVNLVIHKDVPISRLPLLLESQDGQIFNRDTEMDFEAALASVSPSRIRGYLPPLSFTHEVILILDRIRALNTPFAMVIGKPSQNTTLSDLIVTFSGVARLGELITADIECCYLFLSSCSQSTILATLERVLGVSADKVFEDVRFFLKHEEIEIELAALTRQAKRNDIPDYSSISDRPTLLLNYSADPVFEEIPFFTDDHSSISLENSDESDTLFARSSKSPDPVTPPIELAQSKPPGFEAVKRPIASSAVDTNAPKKTSPNNPSPFTIGLKSRQSPPIFNSNSKSQAPIFGKKQAPRAMRSSSVNPSENKNP